MKPRATPPPPPLRSGTDRFLDGLNVALRFFTVGWFALGGATAASLPFWAPTTPRPGFDRPFEVMGRLPYFVPAWLQPELKMFAPSILLLMGSIAFLTLWRKRRAAQRLAARRN